MTQSDRLDGHAILIAEDEALVAMDLIDMVEAAGGTVVGPCSSVSSCRDAFAAGKPVAAILDVRLGKEEVFGVAEDLTRRGVAIVFHSGHADTSSMSNRFPAARFCPKPTSREQLLDALDHVIARRDSASAA